MTETEKFLALDALLTTHAPLLHGREPYWHPKPAPCAKECRYPAWSWQLDGADVIPAEDTVDLDANGAFLAPLSGTYLAHSELEHTGPQPFREIPGYWLIDTHRWSDPRIVSPLGEGTIRPRQWLATPTVELLSKLADQGFWPEFHIHDSWTCEDKVKPSKWATWIRGERLEAIQSADRARYDAIKLGYAYAIQMLNGPAEGERAKSKILRPDWFMAIRAAHAANMWRKAWALLQAGIMPLGMAAVDEITVWRDDFHHLVQLASQDKPVIPIDTTGMKLGAFKVKRMGEQA